MVLTKGFGEEEQQPNIGGVATESLGSKTRTNSSIKLTRSIIFTLTITYIVLQDTGINTTIKTTSYFCKSKFWVFSNLRFQRMRKNVRYFCK